MTAAARRAVAAASRTPELQQGPGTDRDEFQEIPAAAAVADMNV